MTSFSVISMTMRSGETWARSRKSMRGLPRNCGSRMVAGRGFTKVFALGGVRPEGGQAPPAPAAVKPAEAAVAVRRLEQGVGRLQARPPRAPRQGLEAEDGT